MWTNGRKLASGTKGTTSFEYAYNSDGMRTSKTVGNKKYSYYWNGSQLAMMTETDLTSGNVTSVCRFYYDAGGTPIVFDYDGTKYYYVTNLQGDVVGLANHYGTVAYYKYDAWGRIVGTNSASNQDEIALSRNPLRYRGYIYDTETGFYYLQSRYYDPQVGRFINADGYVSTGQGLLGYNMYAYCGNNPVNRTDSSGQFWITLIATASVGLIVSLCFKSKVNFQISAKVDSDSETTTRNKLINDQNGDTGNNFRYGLYSAKHNACEVIAVHNAKVLEGKESSLSETMNDFQSAGAMIGFGTFGSNPYAIGDVLSKEGIDYSNVGLSRMTEPGTYIISFWNNNAPWNGLHTVAVSYNGTTYTAYNLYGNGIVSEIDLSDYSKRFICGYYLR